MSSMDPFSKMANTTKMRHDTWWLLKKEWPVSPAVIVLYHHARSVSTKNITCLSLLYGSSDIDAAFLDTPYLIQWRRLLTFRCSYHDHRVGVGFDRWHRVVEYWLFWAHDHLFMATFICGCVQDYVPRACVTCAIMPTNTMIKILCTQTW